MLLKNDKKVKRYNNVIFGNCIYLQYLNILHLYNREGHKHNKTKFNYNYYYITESFYTNSSHQLFDYKITFVNSQRENTNSKGDLLKNQFEFYSDWVCRIQLISI